MTRRLRSISSRRASTLSFYWLHAYRERRVLCTMEGQGIQCSSFVLPAFAGGMDTDVHAAVIAAGQAHRLYSAYGH